MKKIGYGKTDVEENYSGSKNYKKRMIGRWMKEENGSGQDELKKMDDEEGGRGRN